MQGQNMIRLYYLAGLFRHAAKAGHDERKMIYILYQDVLRGLESQVI